MAQTHPTSPLNPAETYEQIMVKHVFGPLADETSRIARPKSGDRILDVGAGTGIVLRRLARQVNGLGRLTALDVNPALMAVGRASAEADGLSIEWDEGRAEQLPYPGGSFDWAFCQQGLQFFGDKPAALREMLRVLSDGGQVVISVWQGLDRHRYFQVLDDIAFEHAGIHMFHDPFSFHDLDMVRQLLDETGLRDIRTEPVSIIMRAPEPVQVARAQLAAATAVFPSLRELSDEQRSNLVDEVMDSANQIINEHIVGEMLTIPFHAHLAMASR